MNKAPEGKVSLAFLTPVVMDPLPDLAHLRQCILDISETRLPKWRFIGAPDLILQVQAKAGTRPLLTGIAIQGDGITLNHFESWTARRGFVSAAFEIREQGEQWKISLTRWSRRDIDTLDAFKAATIHAIERLAKLDPQTMMFSPACLCCGKPLTDPVSMARWIGPECAHKYSLDVGLFKLS
jgi:hypothetical protein